MAFYASRCVFMEGRRFNIIYLFIFQVFFLPTCFQLHCSLRNPSLKYQISYSLWYKRYALKSESSSLLSNFGFELLVIRQMVQCKNLFTIDPYLTSYNIKFRGTKAVTKSISITIRWWRKFWYFNKWWMSEHVCLKGKWQIYEFVKFYNDILHMIDVKVSFLYLNRIIDKERIS